MKPYELRNINIILIENTHRIGLQKYLLHLKFIIQFQ